MLRSPQLGRRAAARATLTAALFAAAAPAAHAATTVATVPGESLTSSGNVAVVSNTTADAGKALAYWSNATAQKSVSVPSAVGSISVRVRGDQCSGAPTAQLLVDGSAVQSSAASSTSWTTFTATKAIAAGTHTIGVAYTNDYRTSTCDRNLYVDTVTLLGATTTTTTSATTSKTPSTTVAPVAFSSKLRWPRPALSAPTTISVAQGDQWYTLDTTKDYILQLPATVHQGQVGITGGRNVTIVGGAIQLPLTSTKATALSIKDSVGTVHVEGVLFDGSNGKEMDAIQIAAPKATVQVENVRAQGLLGTFDTNHSDIIQPWGGVAALRVDHLTGDSNYQGIFTRPDQGAIGSVTLQNVDMAFNDAKATSSGGYLLWMTTGCSMAPTSLSNVYVQGRATSSLGYAVWPAVTDGACPARITNNTATWPKLPVTGGVIGGGPATGDFVPSGTAGPAYVSPGYGA